MRIVVCGDSLEAQCQQFFSILEMGVDFVATSHLLELAQVPFPTLCPGHLFLKDVLKLLCENGKLIFGAVVFSASSWS